MKSTHGFDYSVNDRVSIRGLENMPGKVDQMVVASEGKQYRVAYWDKGDRKTAWVDPDEIYTVEG